MMNYAKIDLSGMEKELRGIIHKCLNEMLEKLDIREWIQVRIDRIISDNVEKTIEKKVYAFLEESKIEVPRSMRYGSKITINEYIVRMIEGIAMEKASKLLKNLKITLGE